MAGKKLSELSSGSLSNLPLSGVTAVVYSGSTFQHTLSHLRSILVDSGSHVFTGSQVINGDLTVNGSLIANEYILSSSITNIEVQDVSGSSVFGNDMLDTHQFTGSILVTGSVNASNLVGKEFLFVSGFAVIGDPIHHSGSDPEALHVGTTDSYNIAHFKGDNDYYSQVYVTNYNSGSNASTDIVVVADNGTENVHFVNLGINSSTYTGGLVGRENDAYLLNVGKDLYIGTVGGVNHPAKLYLFAEDSWENPQITIHTGSQVTFNTTGFTDGYLYEFSGSVKLQDELKVDGSITSSYFIGDGSQLTNLPTQTTDVSMFLSSSAFNSFTQSIDERTDIIESSLSNLPTNLINLGFGTTSSFDSFTGSINNRVDGLEAATSSYITSIPVPTYISSGPTSPGGSVVANVNTIGINFSEANDFTFNRNGTLTFPDFTIQSTAFNVSSSATTGSNTFVGNQTITGSVDITGSAKLNNDNIVSSNTIEKIETITSASYASITPVSGTLYIIIS